MVGIGRFVLLGLLDFTVSSFAGVWHGMVRRETPRVQAARIRESLDTRELFEHADIVCLGTVTRLGTGAAPGEGEGALPSQLVEVSVETAVKGVAERDTVVIEQPCVLVPDGPRDGAQTEGGEYRPGGQYLLFLKWQEGGSGVAYLIDDDGRYEIDGTELVAVDFEDPREGSLHGKQVGRVLEQLVSWVA